MVARGYRSLCLTGRLRFRVPPRLSFLQAPHAIRDDQEHVLEREGLDRVLPEEHLIARAIAGDQPGDRNTGCLRESSHEVDRRHAATVDVSTRGLCIALGESTQFRECHSGDQPCDAGVNAFNRLGALSSHAITSVRTPWHSTKAAAQSAHESR